MPVISFVHTIVLLSTFVCRGIEYGRGRDVCRFQDRAIAESSGVAASTVNACWWTHNDSGGKARLFAFDRAGRTIGRLRLAGINARDWEDMAAVTINGTAYLVVGDVGDNNPGHDEYYIHIVREPTLPLPNDEITVSPWRTIVFRYDDDRFHNCEAIAVSPDGTIFLATKVAHPSALTQVFALPWPAADSDTLMVAKQVASLPFVLVTAMDMSRDGQRVLLVTYFNAFVYHRGADETWPAALRRVPVVVGLPLRRYGEGGCYGADGEAIYLTGEGRHSRFIELLPRGRR